MDADAVGELRGLLIRIRDNIEEGLQILSDIESRVDPDLQGMYEYVPSVVEAEEVLHLVDSLGVIEDMGGMGHEVTQTVQGFYAAAEVAVGEALEREVREVVVSFITDKTGEPGIAVRIADEVEELNDLGGF